MNIVVWIKKISHKVLVLQCYLLGNELWGNEQIVRGLTSSVDYAFSRVII